MPYVPTNLYPRNGVRERTNDYSFLGNIDKFDVITDAQIEIMNDESQSIGVLKSGTFYYPESENSLEWNAMQNLVSFQENDFPLNGSKDNQLYTFTQLVSESEIEVAKDVSLQCKVVANPKGSTTQMILSFTLAITETETTTEIPISLIYQRTYAYDNNIFVREKYISDFFNATETPLSWVFVEAKMPENILIENASYGKIKQSFNDYHYTYNGYPTHQFKTDITVSIPSIRFDILNDNKSRYRININPLNKQILADGSSPKAFVYFEKYYSSWYILDSQGGKVASEATEFKSVELGGLEVTRVTEDFDGMLSKGLQWRYLLTGEDFDIPVYDGKTELKVINGIPYYLIDAMSNLPNYFQDQKSFKYFKKSLNYPSFYYGETCSVYQNYHENGISSGGIKYYYSYTITLNNPPSDKYNYLDQTIITMGSIDITNVGIEKSQSTGKLHFNSRTPYILAEKDITQSIFITIERSSDYIQPLNKLPETRYFIDYSSEGNQKICRIISDDDEDIIDKTLIKVNEEGGTITVDEKNAFSSLQLNTDEIYSATCALAQVEEFNPPILISQHYQDIYFFSQVENRLKKYQLNILDNAHNIIYSGEEIYSNFIDFHWLDGVLKDDYVLQATLTTKEGLIKTIEKNFTVQDSGEFALLSAIIDDTKNRVLIPIQKEKDIDTDFISTELKTSIWRGTRNLIYDKHIGLEYNYFVDYGRSKDSTETYSETNTVLGFYQSSTNPSNSGEGAELNLTEEDGNQDGGIEELRSTMVWASDSIPPSSWIGTTLYGTLYNAEENQKNIYQVDPNQIWYFNLDTKSGNIDFTTEHNIYATAAQHPRVGISNTNYMTQSVTTKLGYLNEDDMYVGDNGEKLNKFAEFANNGSVKVLRLPNGYLIPVDIQLTNNVTQLNLVGEPSDITFKWTQIGDHTTCVLYGLE